MHTLALIQLCGKSHMEDQVLSPLQFHINVTEEYIMSASITYIILTNCNIIMYWKERVYSYFRAEHYKNYRLYKKMIQMKV